MEFLLSKSGRKFLFATIFMGLVIIGGVTVALLMLRQEAIGTHLKIAKLHARTFGDHISQTIKNIDLASRNTALFSDDKIDLSDTEKSFEEMLQNSPYIRSISMLDANKTVLVSTNKTNIGISVKLDNFLPEPFLNEDLLRFGSPWSGRDLYDGFEILPSKGAKSNEVSFVPVIKSVKNKDEEYTLLVAINSDYFINSYIQSLGVDIGSVDIARIDGTLLFSTDEHAVIGKIPKAYTQLFSSGKDSFSDVMEYDKKESLVSYQLSPSYPIGVVVRLDYGVTLKQWERQRINVLLVTTLLVIISAALTLALIIRHKKQQMMEAQILKSKIVAMGELISMIAHQWRQPLTVVSAIFSNISDAYEDGELTQEYMDKSVKQGNDILRYMSKTIDDFRSFFKPQDSKEEFCLCRAISDAVKLAFGGFDMKGIKIFFNSVLVEENSGELCEKQMSVLGYKNEFLQAVISIIKNSKEAMEAHQTENKAIYIELKESDDLYLATISDNGGGVGEKVAHRIFEPYFTTKHNSIGAGMGLYVTKMLVENGMGGKLGYKNIDNGASFIIELQKSDKTTEGN